MEKFKSEPNQDFFLFELSSEVCNKLGGIFTVIESKVPSMLQMVSYENYFLVGPLLNYENSPSFQRSNPPINSFLHALLVSMNNKGYKIIYGCWLISGRPNVILIDCSLSSENMIRAKNEFNSQYNIKIPENPACEMMLAFGFITQILFNDIRKLCFKPIVVHFHEYLVTMALMIGRGLSDEIKTVFTTHATVLGRELAEKDPMFNRNIKTYNIESHVSILNEEFKFKCFVEKRAAINCNVFTTVSYKLGVECAFLLERAPDLITPNGLNFQNSAINCTEICHERLNTFVQHHFSSKKKFNFSNTLYFFISGRSEFINKGFDVTIQALGKLNSFLRKVKSDKTIIFFIITDHYQPALKFKNIPRVIIMRCISKFLEMNNPSVFAFGASSKVFGYKIVASLFKNKLFNGKLDNVKVMYHPKFIDKDTSPFLMDYLSFVKSCDLGIFPSHYEPWGYTALECLAQGTPAIISSETGLGNYLITHDNLKSPSILFVDLKNPSREERADTIFKEMIAFVDGKQRRMEPAIPRHFDWKNLIHFYSDAYNLALARL